MEQGVPATSSEIPPFTESKFGKMMGEFYVFFSIISVIEVSKKLNYSNPLAFCKYLYPTVTHRTRTVTYIHAESI